MKNKPILLLLFNRPNKTIELIDSLRSVAPKTIYISIDGPRTTEESELTENVNKCLSKIDWRSDVHLIRSDHNLGCKIHNSKAISWFLNETDEGIVLEDDCIAHPSFFKFCNELLDKYRNDERIFHISGNNFVKVNNTFKDSYHFSIFPHCWGWATWKRAWVKFDLSMRDWPEFNKQNKLKNIFDSTISQNYWRKVFQNTYDKKNDSWAYIWTYICWKEGGLSIIPNLNLVKNTGSGLDATHTHKKDWYFDLPIYQLNSPIVHPSFFLVDKKADSYTQSNVFEPGIINKITNLLHL